MLTRSHLWRTSGSKSKALLGNFKAKLTPSQRELFKQFYALLLEGKGGHASIMVVAHKLLHSAFTLSLDSRTQVDSAFEQSMIFTLMTPIRDQYISPAAHTALFAHTQRTIFTTFFHTAWHGGLDFEFEDRDAKVDIDDDDEEGSADEGIDAECEGAKDLSNETEEMADSIPFHRFKKSGPPPLAEVNQDDDDDGWEDAGVEKHSAHSKDSPDDAEEDSEFELLVEREGDDALLA